MRYKVTEPVKDGYSFWDVVDTHDRHIPNFAVVSVYKAVPSAGPIAKVVCWWLNKREIWQ